MTENVTVTAVYIRQYTVVFEDKDGDVLKTEIVDEGASATPPDAPEVEGYTFTGWEGNYSAVAQDEIVAAKYVENAPVTFTVKFVDWNEDVLKTETVRKGSGATAPADPTRDGYVFKGWDKAFDNVTGDMTVTAVYEEVVISGPTIVVSSNTAHPGDTVEITVSLVNNPGVSGVVIPLTFDNTKLEYDSIETTSFENITNQLIAGGRCLYLSWSDEKGNNNCSTDFVTIKFKVKSDATGTTKVEVVNRMLDITGDVDKGEEGIKTEQIAFSVANANITIK